MEKSIANLDAILEQELELKKIGDLRTGTAGGIYAPNDKFYVANVRIQHRYRTRGPRIGLEFDYQPHLNVPQPLVPIDIIPFDEDISDVEYFDPKFRKDGQRYLRGTCRKTSWHLQMDYHKNATEEEIIDYLIIAIKLNRHVLEQERYQLAS